MPRLRESIRLIEQVLAEEAAQAATHAKRPQPATAARLLTAAEAGEYIGRTEGAVRQLIFKQDLPVVRTGRCVRIDRKDLDRWIENNKQ
jgi:excisionase family DNA binding protein